MGRILKQYTIVPDFLYVERGADRQLKDILDDMQRPGYVLVARQMGKTNLLLNAKNKYESEESIFTYIDLSNQFDNEKDCFENIIDRTIDTHEEHIFAEAKVEISELRLRTNKSPQKEYSDELRVLLKYVKDKLVIILDEIDALTKTSYSDNIFAQIRSTYFDRVNYPILNKLTYVLSGVVEPTEIIKNPKISPFNIGQKIFINDFSYDEFKSFIDKTQLSSKLSPDVINRIFYWTNGNPRMTWDLCYEIESCIKENFNEINVDSIVDCLYLTSYNTPPVDNIRELVINDRDLRDGVMQIHYAKENTLSDKIKSKLYLAGIINYNGKEVFIKNEIIKKSLSLNWLRKVEEEDKGLLKIAFELYTKNDFSGAIDAFEQFLSKSTIDDLEESNLIYYHLGYAFYRNNEFEKSLQYLLKCQYKEYDDWYYNFNNLIGLAFLYNRRLDEALGVFDIIIDGNRLDELYLRACVNYSTTVCQQRVEDKYEKAEKILKKITNDRIQYNNKVKEEHITDAKIRAFYLLGIMKSVSGFLVEAKSYYNNSLSLAKDIEKPTILLSLFDVVDSLDEKENIAKNLKSFVLNLNKIDPVDPESSMNFNHERFLDILLLLYANYYNSHYQEIKPKFVLLGNASISSIMLLLVFYAQNHKGNSVLAIKIALEIYENLELESYACDIDTKYHTLKFLAIHHENIVIQEEYIAMFMSNRVGNIDYMDFLAFSIIINYYINNGNYQEALKYISLINSLKPEINNRDLSNYILIEHAESVIQYYQNNDRNAIQYSKTLIDKIDKIGDDIIKNLPIKDDIIEIRKAAQFIINEIEKREHNSNYLKHINSKKYGRNDKVTVRYRDSHREVITKYKNVEEDINLGRCIIIENSNN